VVRNLKSTIGDTNGLGGKRLRHDWFPASKMTRRTKQGDDTAMAAKRQNAVPTLTRHQVVVRDDRLAMRLRGSNQCPMMPGPVDGLPPAISGRQSC
jgi:hypothetical protein